MLPKKFFQVMQILFPELADKLAAIFDFKEKIAQHEEALKQFEKKEE